MAQPDQAAAGQTAAAAVQPVVVKKYANRRLYNTETSSYITLENLAEMVRAGRDFNVFDAKTGEDITRSVLTQIIVEEEAKGSAMLPTAFLRQLIGFYGHSLQGAVPSYLEQAMAAFNRQQQQLRAAMNTFMPPGFEEVSRQNIAMMERAMAMFNPFRRSGADAKPEAPPTAQPGEDTPEAGTEEVARLRLEVESLRLQLAAAHAETVMAQGTAVIEAAEARPAAPRHLAAVPHAGAADPRSARPKNR